MLEVIQTLAANDTDGCHDVVVDAILTARTQQDATRIEMEQCDPRWRHLAEARVASLAKPPGSLGTLEAWYVTLCAVQETLEPAAGPACAIVFVGDHGLMKDSPLSPYPQSATQTMFKALAGGVSCAAVVARSVGASLVVVDVGIDGDVSNAPAANGVEVIHAKVARGTTAFPSPAMTSHVHYTCDDGDDHSHSHTHEHAGYGLSAASAFLHPWSATKTNASAETAGRKVSCATHNVTYHSSRVPSAPGGFASDATRASASVLHRSSGWTSAISAWSEANLKVGVSRAAPRHGPARASSARDKPNRPRSYELAESSTCNLEASGL